MSKSIHISENPVFTIGGLKKAALLFDEFLPHFWFDEKGYVLGLGRNGQIEYGNYEQASIELEGIKDLVPPHSCTLTETFIADPNAGSKFNNRIYLRSQVVRDFIDGIERDIEERGRDLTIWGQERVEWYKENERFNVDACSRIFYEQAISIRPNRTIDIYGWDCYEKAESSVDICLSNINTVDYQSLSWAQIKEIRADTKSVSELRELRRFIVSNMQGLPLSYIEDKLEAALDSHSKAAKRWGLSTLPAELNVDCEVGIVLGLLTAIGAMAAGAPLVPSAVLGTVTPLGQALITINKGKKKIIANSGVSYLHRIKKCGQS